jgi:hypothetical protein
VDQVSKRAGITWLLIASIEKIFVGVSLYSVEMVQKFLRDHGKSTSQLKVEFCSAEHATFLQEVENYAILL